MPRCRRRRDGTGAGVRRSLYGVGRIGIQSGIGVATYEASDGLGSVTDLTASSGTSLAWSEYAPYGQVRSAGSAGAAADPFGFSGQYQDAPTGLYHLPARQYDPGTGRFLTTDPVTASISDPYVGAYVYVRNMPTPYTDPSGRCLILCAILGAVVGGVIGAATYLGATPSQNWSAEGLLGHTALGGATGAVVGFTGGVTLD